MPTAGSATDIRARLSNDRPPGPKPHLVGLNSNLTRPTSLPAYACVPEYSNLMAARSCKLITTLWPNEQQKSLKTGAATAPIPMASDRNDQMRWHIDTRSADAALRKPADVCLDKDTDTTDAATSYSAGQVNFLFLLSSPFHEYSVRFPATQNL